MSLFCKHKYEIIKEIRMYDYNDLKKFTIEEVKKYSVPIYRKLILRCEKCGKIKQEKI